MQHERTVKTGETIWKGQMVGVDTNGLLVTSKSDMVRVVGRADESIAAAPAGSTLKFSQGIFPWINGSSLTEANFGDAVYAADNTTVNATNTNPYVGRVYNVDDRGVWVITSLDIEEEAVSA
jgi:hypothetical protein